MRGTTTAENVQKQPKIPPKRRKKGIKEKKKIIKEKEKPTPSGIKSDGNSRSSRPRPNME